MWCWGTYPPEVNLFLSPIAPKALKGILGLGPVALTAGTITEARTLIPALMQILESQAVTEQNILGVYFQPLVGSNMTEMNGKLSLGGLDPSRYIGNIIHVNGTSMIIIIERYQLVRLLLLWIREQR
ncbi:hypothetical protein RSAG8_10905, partial [Rhizoctonia solani AG-8 WAC10335]